MSQVTDFCESVGLTEPVRRWLREHPGVPLREQIVTALMDAFNNNCPPDRAQPILFLIKRLNVYL